MKRTKWLAAALVLTATAGCKFNPNSTGDALKTPVGVNRIAVAIVVPADGKNEHGVVQQGTGQMTLEVLRDVITSRGGIVNAGRGTLTITPMIEDWTDHVATGGFNRGDDIKVRLRVTDSSGKVLDDRLVTGRRHPETYRQETPYSLLRPLLIEWADRVFAKA